MGLAEVFVMMVPQLNFFVPHRIIYLFLPQMLTLSLLHNNLPPHHLGLFPRESDLQERDKQGRETVSQDSN